jgi:hypothetical protein
MATVAIAERMKSLELVVGDGHLGHDQDIRFSATQSSHSATPATN